MSELWASVWPVVAALLPSIGLGYLFWVIMKHIVEGDRRERAAIRAWEAEQDRADKHGASDTGRNEAPRAG